MDEINKLIMAKVIWGGQSSWSAPIIVVPKGDGGKCLAIDYCTFKKVAWKFIWPMPKVEDIFFQLNGAKYFLMPPASRIPPYSLGWVLNTKNSIFLTIWKIWVHQSTFWTHASTIIFPRCITSVLRDSSFAITYLDDIIIFSRIVENNFTILSNFSKSYRMQPSMKISECHFFTKEIGHLIHILSTTGIRPLPSKIQAINSMHPPKTAKQGCAFLILSGYYRKFIKNIAKMAKPLTLLTC